MKTPCFERLDVFSTKYGHAIYVFFTEWTVFHNMGTKALIFSWKIEKWASYWIFWPIKECSFVRIGISHQLCEWWQGFFMRNLKKMGIRAPCFWEKRRFFWQNMSMRATWFLEGLDVFLTKYGRESSDFFVKSREKIHPIDFFGL